MNSSGGWHSLCPVALGQEAAVRWLPLLPCVPWSACGLVPGVRQPLVACPPLQCRRVVRWLVLVP